MADDTRERILIAGILSGETTFRILIQGPAGAKEVANLIRKLELEHEILAEEPSDPSDPQ